MKQFVLFIRNREDDIYIQYITEFFKYIGCMVTDVTIDRFNSLNELREYININNYNTFNWKFNNDNKFIKKIRVM